MWAQLVATTMMCSSTPALTALWQWAQETPSLHPTILGIGELSFTLWICKLKLRKWFEPRSSTTPWLKSIMWVTGVLRRTVVGNQRFDNLCRSHLQSSLDSEDGFHVGCRNISHQKHNVQEVFFTCFTRRDPVVAVSWHFNVCSFSVLFLWESRWMESLH